MKIKFNADDHLPLNKLLKLYNLTITLSSVSNENDKYYPKIFSTNVCISYKHATQYEKIQH